MYFINVPVFFSNCLNTHFCVLIFSILLDSVLHLNNSLIKLKKVEQTFKIIILFQKIFLIAINFAANCYMKCKRFSFFF